MDNVFYLFREYMGTGLIVIWYLIALIYLWVREKRKEIRVLFLYMPALISPPPILKSYLVLSDAKICPYLLPTPNKLLHIPSVSAFFSH